MSQFRSFDLAQGEDGNSLEFQRDDRHVVFLVFDTRRLCYAELCVLIDGGEGLDEATARIFTERARIASSMAHPAWAALFESGVDDGVFYYAREFVDGERLGDYAERAGPLPERVALEIAIRLGEALLAMEAYPALMAEVDLYDARLFCDAEGRIALKVPGFPLEPLLRRPRGSASVASARLIEVFRRLDPRGGIAPRSELDPGDGEAVALATLVRRMRERCERFPRRALDSDHWPRRRLAEEIYKRRKPTEFLSREFSPVPNAEDPWNPYSQTLVGPKGKVLRLQVLPPPRLLRDAFLAFQKAGTHAAAIAIHAQWKNDDFRLIAEETAPGRSLASLLRVDESLVPGEARLLLERISSAIGELESRGVTVPDFRPENVFACFDDPGGVDLAGLADRRPVTAWPEFHIRLRAHLTMSGLTDPPDVWGLTGPTNIVFEYLSLRGQGLRERAAQLVAGVAEAAEAAAIPRRPGSGFSGSGLPDPGNPEPGAGEVFFGGSRRDGEAWAEPEPEEDPIRDEDSWDADPDAPVSGWGAMGFPPDGTGRVGDDYGDDVDLDDEDGEMDGDAAFDEGVMDWDPDEEGSGAYAGMVLSPIAAAMVGDDRLVEDGGEGVPQWKGIRRGTGWLWVLLFLIGTALSGIAIAHYTGQGFWLK